LCTSSPHPEPIAPKCLQNMFFGLMVVHSGADT
jgi:hypothetical protein